MTHVSGRLAKARLPGTRYTAARGRPLGTALAVILACTACSHSASAPHDGSVADASVAPAPSADAAYPPLYPDAPSLPSGSPREDACHPSCSRDYRDVLGCNDAATIHCTGGRACDAALGACSDPCTAARDDHRSVGCEYYATFMDQALATACFAAFVTNTWDTPAHLRVQYAGRDLPVATFTRIPSGAGPTLSYAAYDEASGIAPGRVAIVFLSGPAAMAGEPQGAQCPVPSAVPDGVLMQQATAVGNAFRIETDVPVVAYQINPYGGGRAEVTGASLLLPTSVWGNNYVAVNAAPYDVAPPSLNIIAMSDATTVTMVPPVDVVGGPGIPTTSAGALLTLHLDKGQQAQISQQGELTGSIIESSQPIGVMAGQQCMRVPSGVRACDHGEQMLPPVKAMGSKYVGVPYRPRLPSETTNLWRAVGAVADTRLSWTVDVGGPGTLQAGQSVTFSAGSPFEVESQDADHPFMLFAYMTGCQALNDPAGGCYGDPDFVLDVPTEQYLSRYVFLADPTYPETNLVLVRSKGPDGLFHDVRLDCAGTITGWQSVGDREWARADLSTGDFRGVMGCSTGAHTISSDAPFGLWVWGWGTPLSTPPTEAVSYAYPAGMDVRPLNRVHLAPQIR